MSSKLVKIKNKIMKTYLIILGLIISLSCSTQINKKHQRIITDVSFTEYISKFNTLQLPLKINCLADFEKYGDNNWKEINGKTILVPNPLCPLIRINEYKYIRDKYPTNKNFYYQSVYKKGLKKYVLLVIEQTNRLTGDFFLKLNVHDLSGNLIDTLSLAGQKIDDFDQYCKIDSSLTIKIRRLKDLTQPPQSHEPWPELETIEVYILTDNGHFKQTYFKQEKGLFTTKENEIIRVDKKK